MTPHEAWLKKFTRRRRTLDIQFILMMVAVITFIIMLAIMSAPPLFRL